MSWNLSNMDSQRSCLSKPEVKAYLNKTLSQQERFEVENHLLDCNMCQDAIDGYIQHPQELQQNAFTPSPFKKWLSIAASVLLLALGGFAIYQYQFANHSNSVFAQFYQKPAWDNQTRGSTTNTAYANAVQNYNQGLYQAAMPTFDSILFKAEEDNQIRLYKGIAHLEMNQYEVADKELGTVRINSDLYFEEASWYLALLHIKLDKPQEAHAYLDEIIELENSFYHAKALELKNRLQE